MSVSGGSIVGDSRALLHTVAKLHYVSNMSQVRIAKQLGLSTATISRLLQKARAEGIVRIEVREIFDPGEVGARLAEGLGLDEVVAADAPAAGALPALAPHLARMLSGSGPGHGPSSGPSFGRSSGPGHGPVLMLGWGRTVRAVIEAGLPAMPGVTVVPSTGGMQNLANHFHSNELARRAAEVTGGVPQLIHAPYLPAPELFRSFLEERSVRDAMALWNRIDMAVVGIGVPYDPANPNIESAARDPVLEGAAGDIVRHYFDDQGRVLDWRGEGRMIAVSAAQLRAAPVSIGLAAGTDKLRSIAGAARSGMINRLITDLATGEALLDHLARDS